MEKLAEKNKFKYLPSWISLSKSINELGYTPIRKEFNKLTTYQFYAYYLNSLPVGETNIIKYQEFKLIVEAIGKAYFEKLVNGYIVDMGKNFGYIYMVKCLVNPLKPRIDWKNSVRDEKTKKIITVRYAKDDYTYMLKWDKSRSISVVVMSDYKFKPTSVKQRAFLGVFSDKANSEPDVFLRLPTNIKIKHIQKIDSVTKQVVENYYSLNDVISAGYNVGEIIRSSLENILYLNHNWNVIMNKATLNAIIENPNINFNYIKILSEPA